MDRYKILRRAILLCCHFARNLAYYQAGWEGKELKKTSRPFWRTLNGNFLDICVLEWCKLFGNDKDIYHWKKIMNNPTQFKNEMFQELNIKQTDLETAWNSIKSYRDEFVAHLEDKETMRIPTFDLPLAAVIFYHKKIIDSSPDKNFVGLPLDIQVFYDACYSEAIDQYKS